MRIEPGNGPVGLPQFHVMVVDQATGGRDGGVIIGAIHLNHPDGSAVQPDDMCMIDRHLNLHMARTPASSVSTAAAGPESQAEGERQRVGIRGGLRGPVLGAE
jgi:hypothetical protein